MKCSECGGTGWTQIALNVKGIKRCTVCNGTGVVGEPELSKEEYVKMLNERLGYLKDDIEFFAKYGGPTEENRLWAIKEQLSCMIRLVNQCDIDLFPDTIHLDNEYGRC